MPQSGLEPRSPNSIYNPFSIMPQLLYKDFLLSAQYKHSRTKQYKPNLWPLAH